MRFFCALIILFNFAWAQETPEWQSMNIREDLYLLRNREIANGLDLSQLNAKLINSINNYIPNINDRRASGISYEQAQKLLVEVRMDNYFLTTQPKYEESNVRGLCFGRAIFFHLMLLRYGVNKDSIKKIFAIGPLESGSNGIDWQFHTATIVKDDKTGKWWALDTNFDDPLSVEDWTREMKRRSLDKTFRLFREPEIDKTKELRFYITEAQKIGPSGWEYNIKLGGLFDPFYNGYFKDIFALIKNKSIGSNEKFNKKVSCEFLMSSN